MPADAVAMEAVDGEEAEQVQRPFMLDSLGIADRDSCIVYAEGIRDIVKDMLEKLEQDNEHYTEVTSQVEKLNNYAQEKYAELKKNIFIDAGTNYFTILQRFPRYWMRMKMDFRTKYQPLRDEGRVDSEGKPYKSDWRGPIIMAASIFMLVYMFVAALISNIILRVLVPKRYRGEVFRNKRGVYIILLGTLLFAIAIMVVRTFMRSNLMVPRRVQDLPALHPHVAHRDLVPHHPHPQLAGQHHLPAPAPGLHHLADLHTQELSSQRAVER